MADVQSPLTSLTVPKVAPKRARHRLRLRHHGHPVDPVPADSGVHDRLWPCHFDRLVGPDSHGLVVDSAATGFLVFSDDSPHRHHAATLAQHRDDARDPVSWPRRPRCGRWCHCRLCKPGHVRRFRHRSDRLPDSDRRELHRHHQGCHAYRRSRRPFHLGRHSRQADVDRRRPFGRHDR